MNIFLIEIIGFVVRCGTRFATMPDRIAMSRVYAGPEKGRLDEVVPTLHNRRMTMKMSRLGILTVCGLTMILAGCTTYYRVTDPASGKEYYTTKVDEKGKSGAVKIRDDKSGSSVTLQSSEVREISEDEYKQATGKK